MLMIIACGVSAQMKAFIKKVDKHCLYLAIICLHLCHSEQNFINSLSDD